MRSIHFYFVYALHTGRDPNLGKSLSRHNIWPTLPLLLGDNRHTHTYRIRFRIDGISFFFIHPSEWLTNRNWNQRDIIRISFFFLLA